MKSRSAGCREGFSGSGGADALIAAHARLSRRERDVVYLLRSGRSYAQVQTILVLSNGSVRTYAQRAFRKLDVISRWDLPRVTPSEELRTKLRTTDGPKGAPAGSA
jgi:DNA-binding CsgD family transcriptional regulator